MGGGSSENGGANGCSNGDNHHVLLVSFCFLSNYLNFRNYVSSIKFQQSD